MTLFPRLVAATKARNAALLERHHARIQRNAVQEQRDRAYDALSAVVREWTKDEFSPAFHNALRHAAAQHRVGLEYDRVQVLTDPSYQSALLIQENSTP